jgi:hypothetical protein
MNDIMELACSECGRTIVFDAAQRRKLLDEITRPAQTIVVECACERFQFVLASRRTRGSGVTERCGSRRIAADSPARA